MIKVLRLMHFIGLVIFLGSIFTFIVVSALTQDASLENLAFGRRIISAGTAALTVPGMWVIAVTGAWMGYRRYGYRSRFAQIKLLLVALVIVNAYVFILPAADAATGLAKASLAQGRLLEEYGAAYLQETLFGALNVMLTLTAAVVGVWKIGGRSPADV